MKITYFGIKNCEYEQIDNRPAIIAPARVSDVLLRSNGFIQLVDGRWCHFMADYEIKYFNESGQADTLEFPPLPSEYQSPEPEPQGQKKADIITIISVISVASGLTFRFIDKESFGFIFVPIGVVLIIITRILYPYHKPSKVIAWLYAALAILYIIMLMMAFFLVMHAIETACDSL